MQNKSILKVGLCLLVFLISLNFASAGIVPTSSKCTDYDGDNPYVNSYVLDFSAGYRYDHCDTIRNIVTEGICRNDHYTTVQYNCFCAGGKCLNQPTTTVVQSSCSETDSGRDYYTFGRTSGYDGTYWGNNDVCLDSNRLVEHWCLNNHDASEIYTCPCGCSGNACNQCSQPTTTYYYPTTTYYQSSCSSCGSCGSCPTTCYRTTTTRTTTTTTVQTAQSCGWLKVFKFNDANGNGVWNSGEVGVPGFTFHLVGQGKNFYLTTTSGGVAITDCIPAGSYTVTEDVLSGWQCTTGTTRSATVTNNQLSEVMFGNRQIPSTTTTTTTTTTIGDCGYLKIFKFNDANENGVWNDGEVGVPGFTFNVFNLALNRDIDITTESGGVAITDCIPVGTYQVTEEVLDGWRVTTAVQQSATVTKNLLSEVRFGNVQIPENETTTTTTFFDFTPTPTETTTTIPFIPPPKILENLRIYVNLTCVNHGVQVRVLRNSEKKVKSAEIDIFYNDKKVAYGRTNFDGVFEFTPENTGSYYILARKSGYETADRYIEIPDCTQLCYDGIKNQDEVDVDCGGSCPCCEAEKKCKKNDDCCGNYCYKGICRTPSCTDGILNQGEEKTYQIMSDDETDLSDCGGLNCPDCPTCFDGIKNQGERGIDCGGPCEPCCPTCSNCADGKKNQGETDIDCGGPCATCNDGLSCRLNEDCLSNYCYNRTCRTPTCSDGIQNQDEKGIDCGGSCDTVCQAPRVGIIGSLIAFSSERTGTFLFLILLLFLILCYFAYRRGKEKGRKEREIETDINYVSEEQAVQATGGAQTEANEPNDSAKK